MENKIKIVFMGTPDFAVLPLKSLINDNGMEVRAVITQPDKPAGRSQKLTEPPIKGFALDYGIIVYQPDKIRKNHEFYDLLKSLTPDFIVTAAYGKILPPEILKIPKYCCLNIHASLLPKYRGASPVEQALLNGDPETGISFIKMDEKMDTGDIFEIKKMPISDHDDNESLRLKLSKVASEYLPELLKSIFSKQHQLTPQDNKYATYCDKIEKNDGLLKPSEMSSKEILNRIRAFNPWPTTFIIFNDKRIKILDAEIIDSIAETHFPGDLLPYNQNKNLALFTADGTLKINKIQIEGKKAAASQDFLRGNGNFFNKFPTKAK